MSIAVLVYVGSRSSWHYKFKRISQNEFPLDRDVVTIGRAGNIGLPEDDWVSYIGEGHDEIGVKKEIQTSRFHAQIVREVEMFFLEDMGSKVGTYVNGKKLGKPQEEPWKVRYCHSPDYYPVREPRIRENNKGRAELKHGDRISLGQEIYGDAYAFEFRLV